MEAVNTVVGLWINCLHHKSIITVVVVVGVLQECFEFSTAKCELHRCSVCDPEKENGMKKS
jgi:CTP:phosphocholine cytidylyltransferase-like protein